ncbi:MAG: ABC transporter ATP-binding protein [Candidatus Nezhaarchaeales archaeon]
MSNSLLELQEIRTYFYVRKGLFKTLTVKAVDGVSLSINRGETVAIVGESGSGKSTLGRTALKLVEPVSGKIIFEGKDITNLHSEDLKWFRRKAQMIFQDPYTSLNPFMTIKQIVEEPLVVHGFDAREREERVIKALEDVRLLPPETFLSKYPHMLSGGQRQRVGIARCLVLEPVFIVADEPVSMIDASSRVEILLLMRSLQRKYGIGVMYITHDIATTKYFSDKIAVMYAGKLLEIGPSQRVLKEPLHPYTVALIDAVPDPDPHNRFRLRRVVTGEPPSPLNPPSGCRFHPRCPYSDGKKCVKEEPEMIEVDVDRKVACHYVEKFVGK